MPPVTPALALFEAMPNPCLLLAPDSPTFTIVDVNEAYLRATMTDRQAIMGRPLFEAFPDDPEAPEALQIRNLRVSLDRAIATRQPDRMPLQPCNIRRSDGTLEERHWRPLSMPVLGLEGEVVSLIHYVEDATQSIVDARRAQAALVTSEARYRAIVESSIDFAMVATDLSGTVTTWNTGAEHILGWTAEEMVGHTVDRFFTPEDRANRISEQEMHNALTKGRGIDERWHLRKGGERFWASGEMMPLKDEAGSVFGFIKILRDRTPQRETELALERQSSLLRTVTDHVSEAVFRVDPDGSILLANPAAERLFGWSADELRGRNFHDVLHHHHENGCPFPADACTLVHALRDGTQLLNEETVFFRKDGAPVPVVCTNVPFREDGGVMGAVITVTDVTERRQAQERQQVINHELSHRLKNTLAMVQAIAAQTLRGVTDRDAVRALEQRLTTLSRAHDILLQRSWVSADIRDVVTGTLALHADAIRLRVEGSDLALGPRGVLSLSMLLHELATNAAKYGALSAAGGFVSVTWTITDGTLALTWQERAGPPIVEPPTRGGFGSRLIRMGLVGTGGSDLRYEPCGLRAEFQASVQSLSDA